MRSGNSSGKVFVGASGISRVSFIAGSLELDLLAAEEAARIQKRAVEERD